MLAQPVCRGCGQPIRGDYLSALEAAWHPEHFLCAACSQPIGETSFCEHEDAPYHIACYKLSIAPRCAACGRSILDEAGYYNHDGGSYHIDCYKKAVAPRCLYCSKPLFGEYLVDYWGTKFCKEHEQHYPHCSFCGRLATSHGQELGIERVRCSVCQDNAIETAEEARPLFRQLIRWVSGQGLRYNNLRLNLELCESAKLARHLQESGPTRSLGATMGSVTRNQDGQVVLSSITGVAVLQGLPSTLFQGVTIHELGHVWLMVQGVLSLPLWAEEGFCELLAHRYYTEIDTLESRYHATSIELRTNPIYGEGFRRIRILADTTGFQRFITVLQTRKTLP
jgi:hypothetical protein